MTEERLREIEERCEEMPHGPWYCEPEGISASDFVANHAGSGLATVDNGAGSFPALYAEWHIARWAAHARADLPDCAAEIRKLQAEIEKLKRRHTAYYDKIGKQLAGVREKRWTGEPANSDREEIRRLIVKIRKLEAARRKDQAYIGKLLEEGDE